MSVDLSEVVLRDGLPRNAFAYAPTADPESWTLPYLTADGEPDIDALAEAVDAVTRGDVPDSSVAMIEAKLRQAYRRAGEDIPDALAEAHGGHFYGARKALAGGGGGGGGASPTATGTPVKPGEYTDHDTLIADMSAKWGGDWSEIAKVPLPLANDAAATIDDTFTRFGPSPLFKGVRSPDHGPGGVIAEVKRVNPAEKGSAVFLYQHYWGSEAKMDSLWQGEHASPMSSISASATTRSAYARSIVQHELGHEYMGFNLHARFGANRDEPSRKAIEPWFHNTFLPSLKTAHVSKYARKNEHEAWAELFAAATGYGTSKSHFPAELKGILDQFYPLKESGFVPDDSPATFREDATDDAADAIPCGWSHRHPDIGATEDVEEAHGGHWFGARKGIGKGGGVSADKGKRTPWSAATSAAWASAKTGDRVVAEMSNGVSKWDVVGKITSTSGSDSLSVASISGFTMKITPDKLVSMSIVPEGRDYPGAPVGAVRTDAPGFMSEADDDDLDRLADALLGFGEAHGGHFYGSRKSGKDAKGGGGGGGGGASPAGKDHAGWSAQAVRSADARYALGGHDVARMSDAMDGSVGKRVEASFYDKTSLRAGDDLVAQHHITGEVLRVEHDAQNLSIAHVKTIGGDVYQVPASFTTQFKPVGTEPVRVSVKPHTYRGKDGFLISGRDSMGRQVSIQTGSKTSAEAIRARLKDGREDWGDLLEADSLGEGHGGHYYGPWKGGKAKGGGGPSGPPGGYEQLADRAEAGGFTVGAFGGGAPRDGFMVSPYPEREMKVAASDLKASTIKAYLQANSDLLDDPGHFLGGWRDGDTIYLDVSVRAASKAEAAVFGKGTQLAAWDVKGQQEVALVKEAAAAGRRAYLDPDASDAEIKAFIAYLLGEDEDEDEEDDVSEAQIAEHGSHNQKSHGRKGGGGGGGADAGGASGAAPLTAAEQAPKAGSSVDSTPGPGGDWGAQGSPEGVWNAVAAGKEVSIRPNEVSAVMDAAAKRADHPDLTDLKVDGTLKFGGDGLGLARSQMPQLPESHLPKYMDELRARGITVTEGSMDPRDMHPIQREVSAQKAGKILAYMRESGPLGQVVISSDNFVLDGHHRWGAATALAFERAGTKLGYVQVGLTGKELLADANKWTEAQGIAKRSISEGAWISDGLTEFREGAYEVEHLAYILQRVVVQADPGFEPLVEALATFGEAHGGHFYGSRKSMGKGGGGGGAAGVSAKDAYTGKGTDKASPADWAQPPGGSLLSDQQVAALHSMPPAIPMDPRTSFFLTNATPGDKVEATVTTMQGGSQTVTGRVTRVSGSGNDRVLSIEQANGWSQDISARNVQKLTVTEPTREAHGGHFYGSRKGVGKGGGGGGGASSGKAAPPEIDATLRAQGASMVPIDAYKAAVLDDYGSAIADHMRGVIGDSNYSLGKVDPSVMKSIADEIEGMA